MNLDSEVEGELLLSCAGGIRSESILEGKFENNNLDAYKCLEIKIKGLKGGHSGMEIHKERGNSNKIMGRILKDLENNDIRVVSLNGGSKNNAIPREADAKILVKAYELENVKSKICKMESTLKNEYKMHDNGLLIEICEIDFKENAFDSEWSKKIINLLYLYPNGVNTMSMAMEGLVESSTNLGVVKTDGNKVYYDSAIRSSVGSLKNEIVLRAKTITEILGGTFKTNAGYPEWEYNENSKIREICVKTYEEMYGKKPKLTAIHAGLECGLFKDKLSHLDMISFGPNLYDVHTPNEHMSIKSVENIWKYLLNVLEKLN